MKEYYTIEEIMAELKRLELIEQEYPLSEYNEWYRDYLYERLEELNENLP